MPAGVTELLAVWSAGDKRALDALIPLVYGELHRLAHRFLRGENAGHALQSTALVNEAYMRLAGASNVEWRNRVHFFAISARIIRRILVDEARARRSEKRGSGFQALTLDEAIAAPAAAEVDLELLDDALQELAKLDAQQSRIVELRFFTGLSIEETAEALAISKSTVKRDWALAKAWIYREISKNTRS